MVKSRLVAVASLFLIVLPVYAAAQTAGAIAGTVRDSSGAIMPGVTVEASSPALIEQVRSVVTDQQGQYRIVDLRTGVYTVTFTLPGFSTVKREGVELSVGFTAAVNAEMQVGGIQETLTVSGASPVVDVQNVVQQRVMTREVIDAIPSGKIFSNLAVLVPGMNIAGSGSTVVQDVGGQAGFNFIRLSIHGSRSIDQSLALDGYFLTNLSNNADTTTQIPVDAAMQEYTIETSARSAENETSGVKVNLVPKSGGNEYRGSLSTALSNSSMQSDNYSTDLQQLGLKSPNRAKSLWNVAPSFGGPLKTNKLWFMAAGQRTSTDNYEAGNYANADQQGWTYVPNLSEQKIIDQRDKAILTKVTWQPSPRNRFNFYYEYNYYCNCHFTSAFVAPEAAIYATFPNKVYQGTWSLPISNRILIETGASLDHVDPYHLTFRPEANGRSIVDNSGPYAGMRSGSTGSDTRIDSRLWDVRSSLSYVTGTHNLKMGIDTKLGYAPQTTFVPNNISYVFLNGRPSTVTISTGPLTRENDVLPNMGVFAQDQFTRKRLTLNGGLRFDYFRTSYPDQTLEPAQYRPVALNFPGASVIHWKDLGPRLGAAFDLSGNGKTALKWSLGRYVEQKAIVQTSAVNPVSAVSATQTRTWTDNGDLVIQGNPLIVAANDELGPSNNATFGTPVITTRIDPAFASGLGVRPYNWEMSAGIQHELIPSVSVSGSYFRRWFGNFEVSDNLALNPTDYDSYCVTAPVDPRLPRSGQRICGLVDVNPAKRASQNFITRSSEFYGKQIEHWNGADFLVNARLSGGVLLQGGLSTGKTTIDNCDVVTKLDLATTATAPSGPSTYLCHAEAPFQINAKLLGSYTLPWAVQVAATYQSVPGPMITAAYTARNSQIEGLGRDLSSGVSGTVTVPLVGFGEMYGERMHQLDLRLSKTFKVGRSRWQGLVDVYNLLNSNFVLTQNNTYGTNGASWQVPTSILPARIARIGLQLDF